MILKILLPLLYMVDHLDQRSNTFQLKILNFSIIKHVHPLLLFHNEAVTKYQTLHSTSFYQNYKHRKEDVVNITILSFSNKYTDIFMGFNDSKCE